MDQFIKDLTDMLSQREEKTILVLYGDHLPALQFDEDTLLSHDMYKTEYLIWDNFGLEKDDGSLKAYQLTSHVLGKLNITDGIINRFHQTCQQESTYLTDLRKLQYDALYGEHYLTGGQPAYEPAEDVYKRQLSPRAPYSAITFWANAFCSSPSPSVKYRSAPIILSSTRLPLR